MLRCQYIVFTIGPLGRLQIHFIYDTHHNNNIIGISSNLLALNCRRSVCFCRTYFVELKRLITRHNIFSHYISVKYIIIKLYLIRSYIALTLCCIAHCIKNHQAFIKYIILLLQFLTGIYREIIHCIHLDVQYNNYYCQCALLYIVIIFDVFPLRQYLLEIYLTLINDQDLCNITPYSIIVWQVFVIGTKIFCDKILFIIRTNIVSFVVRIFTITTIRIKVCITISIFTVLKNRTGSV